MVCFALFILTYPLGIDSSVLYPIEGKESASGFEISKVSIAYDENLEEAYFQKTNEDLNNLATTGDVVALTELGERYYSGQGTEKDFSVAVAYFIQAAESEYPVAQFILGKLYDEGQVVSHDSSVALDYYQKAAYNGYAPAQYALGQKYYLGQDCAKNDAEALCWILKCAETLDDPDVYLVLSMIYKDSEDNSIRDEKKAFSFAQKAAEMEDENAYNLLGTLYELGCGVEQNYEKAFYYYRLAAENGVEIAYLNIGAFYQSGVAIQKDDLKAAEYFQYGANAGNMYCLNALGMCYKNGMGVKQNYQKAFELFLQSAYAGNFAGELNTGLAYDEGQGVLENKAEAKRWFTLAAEHGSSKAMVALGYYIEKGIPDGEPNLNESFKWYLRAAEVGDHPFAAWVVGNCYSQGLMGVEADRCTAFEWYLKAAKLGQATAQNNVACEYLKGEIVDLDYSVAIDWFEKALAQNDMYALDNYGTILMNGDGVPRDAARAFLMYKKAAELGSVESQCNLGICYFEGWGTRRDLDKALKWLVAAFKSSSEIALGYLQKGFKEKNGNWVKRGFFGHIPAPNQLPTPSAPPKCSGGCEDLCTYVNMRIAEKLSYREEFCYCELLDSKVFRKTKYPYFKNSMADLIKASGKNIFTRW